ncbi:MAG: hypothetical protein ACW990_18405 [Promethearchaeota archaeon]
MKLDVHKSIPFNLKTEFISDGKRHDGIIENLSNSGMIVSTNTAVKVTNKAAIEIKCKLFSNDILRLHCEVIWYSIKKSSQEFKLSMGLTILNPPMIYNDFLHFINKSSFPVGI